MPRRAGWSGTAVRVAWLQPNAATGWSKSCGDQRLGIVSTHLTTPLPWSNRKSFGDAIPTRGRGITAAATPAASLWEPVPVEPDPTLLIYRPVANHTHCVNIHLPAVLCMSRWCVCLCVSAFVEVPHTDSTNPISWRLASFVVLTALDQHCFVCECGPFSDVRHVAISNNLDMSSCGSRRLPLPAASSAAQPSRSARAT